MKHVILWILVSSCLGACGPSQRDFNNLRQEVDHMRLMLDPAEGVVTARAIYILDSSGKQRAVLATTSPEIGNSTESPLLTFLDVKGRKRIFLIYSDALHEGAIGAFGHGGEVIEYDSIGSLFTGQESSR